MTVNELLKNLNDLKDALGDAIVYHESYGLGYPILNIEVVLGGENPDEIIIS